jgi:hypothetical protein
MGHVPHDALQTPQFFLKHAWTDVTPKIIIHVLWLYKSQRKNDTGGGGDRSINRRKKEREHRDKRGKRKKNQTKTQK